MPGRRLCCFLMKGSNENGFQASVFVPRICLLSNLINLQKVWENVKCKNNYPAPFHPSPLFPASKVTGIMSWLAYLLEPVLVFAFTDVNTHISFFPNTNGSEIWLSTSWDGSMVDTQQIENLHNFCQWLLLLIDKKLTWGNSWGPLRERKIMYCIMMGEIGA